MSVIEMPASLIDLAEQVGTELLRLDLVLATAESCSGGGIAYMVTEIAGSSHWFERAYVTYSNQSKQQMLGVKSKTLEQYGAVSEPTVQEMLAGTLLNSEADVATAVSGIAGPSGGSELKPVGMVCFAWGRHDMPVVTKTAYFSGNRHEIRIQTIEMALTGVLDLLSPAVMIT
jgi:nicotinamide-nucleotide amidase